MYAGLEPFVARGLRIRRSAASRTGATVEIMFQVDVDSPIEFIRALFAAQERAEAQQQEQQRLLSEQLAAKRRAAIREQCSRLESIGMTRRGDLLMRADVPVGRFDVYGSVRVGSWNMPAEEKQQIMLALRSAEFSCTEHSGLDI